VLVLHIYSSIRLIYQWPDLTIGIKSSSDAGLTTIYFGGYNTGAMLSWLVVPELFNIDIAAFYP
jgi:hypothetical protein